MVHHEVNHNVDDADSFFSLRPKAKRATPLVSFLHVIIMGAGKRKKCKISKHKKKAWNKFCNVEDIEDYLEEKRFEERVGGAAREKPDAELYFLQNTQNSSVDVPKKNFSKPLRCFQNIGAFSKVPPINPTKRINRKNLNIQLNHEDRKLSALVRQVNKTKVSENIKKSEPFLPGRAFKDLWDEEKKPDPEVADLIKYRDILIRKRIFKTPGFRFIKPSRLPAVQPPHAGASYNPTATDHQVLIDKAVSIEHQKERKELHLKRVLTDMFPTKSEAPTAESILAEMSQGLFDADSTDEECDPSDLRLSKNPPVTTRNRLTRKRRRRKREIKDMRRMLIRQKLKEYRDRDFGRLPSILAELHEAEQVSEVRQVVRQRKRLRRPYQVRKLSNYRYEPPDLEVQLAGEITGSLRLLKKQGDLLEDRHKSLQRRNLIEPRIRQKRQRKYKLKYQVKRSHREPEKFK